MAHAAGFALRDSEVPVPEAIHRRHDTTDHEQDQGEVKREGAEFRPSVLVRVEVNVVADLFREESISSLAENRLHALLELRDRTGLDECRTDLGSFHISFGPVSYTHLTLPTIY